jgi:heme exporter protein D
MTIYWNSFAEFLAMGGYAPYVWGSFGVTALVVAAEIVALWRRQRTLRRDAGRNGTP